MSSIIGWFPRSRIGSAAVILSSNGALLIHNVFPPEN
jgi:hypothetical protein